MYRDLEPACTCWWGPPWAPCWSTAAGQPLPVHRTGASGRANRAKRRHTACMPVSH